MSRHNYPLSEETIKVLSDFVKPTAQEMNVDKKYVHAILAGTEPDRFASFRYQFKAAAYAGAPVEIWLNELVGINFKAQRIIGAKNSDALAVLLEKIDSDAASTALFVDALKDGHLSKTECHVLLSAINKMRDITTRAEQLLQHRLGELNKLEEEK